MTPLEWTLQETAREMRMFVYMHVIASRPSNRDFEDGMISWSGT